VYNKEYKMKKVILSLSVAIVTMLTLVGCGKGSTARVNVGGVNINTLDGHGFEKSGIMGKTMYIAKLDPKDGFAANVNVILDENKGTLPTMEEFLKMSMAQYETLHAKMQVQTKTDSVVTVSGTMGKLKLCQRVFRDSAKNRFVVITGTYKEDSDKGTIEKCVNSAEL
jgi:hypothetical protein